VVAPLLMFRCQSSRDHQALKAAVSRIPDDVVLFKIDYDTSAILKIKYGVTYQHAYVQVDRHGNMIAIWNGGDIDALLSKIQ